MADDNFQQCECTVLLNECLKGLYWRMRLDAPGICASARPGQFVHLLLPALEGHVLRRPFSICDVQGNTLTLVYKTVGDGTRSMTSIPTGTSLDLLGPLGHGFTAFSGKRPSLLLGGGYGCAAMLFAARRLVEAALPPPVVLLGARTREDILLVQEFEELGCTVRISTDDGSCGVKGRITLLLEEELGKSPDDICITSCGPRPMLEAVARLAATRPDCKCEVSLDERMCCGVGACFGCVLKVKDASAPEGWKYLRSCKEGPVFNAAEILWRDDTGA